jgi:hypothetical protein
MFKDKNTQSHLTIQILITMILFLRTILHLTVYILISVMFNITIHQGPALCTIKCFRIIIIFMPQLARVLHCQLLPPESKICKEGLEPTLTVESHKGSNVAVSNHVCKYWPMVLVTDIEKHSSLLRYGINYDQGPVS